MRYTSSQSILCYSNLIQVTRIPFGQTLQYLVADFQASAPFRDGYLMHQLSIVAPSRHPQADQARPGTNLPKIKDYLV